MNEYFGTELFFDAQDFYRLLVRLGVDLFFVTFVVWVVYYRVYKNREFVFTYYVFNVITFSLCVLLRKVPMELGFALGLFGVFGILRYRTEQIRIRDLTYLFICIGLALINAVANKKVSAAELLAVDSVIVGLCAILELPRSARMHGATPMIYDNLALETVWGRYETVLCSDAGKPFELDAGVGAFAPRQLFRVMDISQSQALALRKRMLINEYQAGRTKGAFWAINTPITDYKAASLAVSPEKIADLGAIRTRLDRFKEQEQCELVNWGYAVSDAAIRAYAAQVIAVQAEAKLPYSKYPLA